MAASYSSCSLLSFNDAIEEEKKMVIKSEKTSLPTKTWRSLKKGICRVRRRRKLVIGLAKRVILASVQAKKKLCKILQTRSRSSSHLLLNYDINSYSKNFDDGKWQEEVDYYRTRSFAYRFGHNRS